jgi:hypothetical protein
MKMASLNKKIAKLRGFGPGLKKNGRGSAAAAGINAIFSTFGIRLAFAVLG